MIIGVYDTATGAKIDGAVYFPEPVDVLLPVTFLVDTGAIRSCLSFDDLNRLGPNALSRLPTRDPVETLRGIGGAVALQVTDAAIGLPHEDGGISMFVGSLALMLDESFAGLPSILGRDILFHGELRFDPRSGKVFFDPPKEDIQV